MLSPFVAHSVYVGVIEKAPIDWPSVKTENGVTTADATDGDGNPYKLRADAQGLGGKHAYLDVYAGLANGEAPKSNETRDEASVWGDTSDVRGKVSFIHGRARPGFTLDDEKAGNLVEDNNRVDEADRRKRVSHDMYDLATHIGEENNMSVVESDNQTPDGRKFWYGSNQEGQWRIKDKAEPMDITFQLLKAKSYIQDRPKRLAQAKVQRLSRKVKNARTQHKYKRNLARGAIRPKMRTQTGLIRVTRSR